MSLHQERRDTTQLWQNSWKAIGFLGTNHLVNLQKKPLKNKVCFKATH